VRVDVCAHRWTLRSSPDGLKRWDQHLASIVGSFLRYAQTCCAFCLNSRIKTANARACYHALPAHPQHRLHCYCNALPATTCYTLLHPSYATAHRQRARVKQRAALCKRKQPAFPLHTSPKGRQCAAGVTPTPSRPAQPGCGSLRPVCTRLPATGQAVADPFLSTHH